MRLRNIIRMGLATLKANICGSRVPLNVMLSLTNRCLSSCSYCNIPNRNQREMTTEEIFDLIEQISEIGAQRLGLWGGEPLLREDIGRIIDYAKEKGLFVTLDSSGYLIPEKVNLLRNLDHLILAFDGPEDMHDLNRERGSFKKIMQAIEAIKDTKNVWTITVLTKNNLKAVDFILETAKRYGFLATFQILHHNDKLGRNLNSLLPAPDAYRSAIRKILYERERGAPIASSTSYLRYILAWPDYTKPTLIGNNGLKCWAGRLYCNVDTDGSVYPCSLLIEKAPSLNFLEVGFKKAFDYLQEINFPCKACDASCYTEYNYLYSLNIKTIFEWLKSMKAS